MKRVLVTGAAGTLGLQTIKYLLSEGKYNITVLDLKNKKVFRNLKKYRKRVDVIYGDVLDRNLVEKLVKNTDIIIHLASCLPPVCNYYKDIPKIIELDGTENIVRAINYYNPKCYLIYGSTTSLYTKDTSSKIITDTKDLDLFSANKVEAEKIIRESLRNYTILRFPLIMGDLGKDNFIYSVDKNEDVEVVTKEDAAEAIISSINNFSKANKKTFNIGGGETCRINFNELLNRILNVHGVSNKFICGRFLVEKTFTSPYLKDTDKANEILGYQNDSLTTYFRRQNKRSHHRKIRKLLGKLFISKRKVK